MEKPNINAELLSEENIRLENKDRGEKVLDTYTSEDASIKYAKTLSRKDILEDRFDRTKLTRNAEDFRLNYEDYPILRRHVDHKIDQNGKMTNAHKNIDVIGYTYTRYTSDLINEICGVYEVDNYKKEKALGPNSPNVLTRKESKTLMDADHVIYLDKSGRPVQYFVDVFWKEFAPKDGNGKSHPKPSHSFVNLDRISVLKHLFGLTGINESNAYIEWERHKNEIDASHLAQLRSLFLKEPLNPDENPSPEDIMKMPTILDGKNALVVDEVKFGGLSMTMATYLLSRAIPEANFAGTTFWQDATSPIGNSGANNEKTEGIGDGKGLRTKEPNSSELQSLPVWYDKMDTRGRGIGDVDIDWYKQKYDDAIKDAEDYISRSPRPLSDLEKTAIIKRLRNQRFTEKYGAAFRGVRLNLGPGGDDGEKTRKLTKDIFQLLKDYRAHKIFPWANPKQRQAGDDYYVQMVRSGIDPAKYASIREEINAREPDIY